MHQRLVGERRRAERCASQGFGFGHNGMVLVYARRIQAENLRARLILQVHDELIVEAPEDEVDRVKALLKDCMEGVVALKVPLRADISTGGDWRECK